MIYVFLADGFEEVEAVAPIDMLRRAGCEVILGKVGEIGVNDGHALSSHDITIHADRHIFVRADMLPSDIDFEKFYNLKNLEMIVLPGGAVGVENLYNSETVKKIIDYCVGNTIPIGAICAAPSILARMGYLKDIRATAYPTFRHYLTEGGAIVEEEKKVVTDGIFTTAAAAGVSLEFGLELVRVLKGKEVSEKIAEQILL